jgi:transposase-like protein
MHAGFWSRGGQSDLSIDCNWSLLQRWLRPHRGISQEELPLYLGCFAFVHNVRKRGNALLPALSELRVTYDPGTK